MKDGYDFSSAVKNPYAEKLILPAQNGNVVLSNVSKDWWRVSVTVSGREISYGCEQRKLLCQKILDGIRKRFPPKEVINGASYNYLCNLSEPHSSIYISSNLNYPIKLMFIPDGVKVVPQGKKTPPDIENVRSSFKIPHYECDLSDEKNSDITIIELSEKDYRIWIEKCAYEELSHISKISDRIITIKKLFNR